MKVFLFEWLLPFLFVYAIAEIIVWHVVNRMVEKDRWW